MAKKRPPTVAQLCVALGVSESMVGRYLRQGMDRETIKAAKKWKAENIKSRPSMRDLEYDEDVGLQLRRAELCQRLENARTRYLKNERLEATLIHRSEVESRMATCMHKLETVLAKLPDGIASQVAEIAPDLAEVVKEKIRTKIELALREFQAGTELADDEDIEDCQRCS